MMRDNKERFARWLQSILALNVLAFRHRLEGLPENIYDIQDVNVYEANGIQGDDWESYVNDQGQAWIFTPLHQTMSGLRNIRKASGGGTWDEKGKIYENPSCCVRKYKFKVKSKNKKQATNERMRLRKYTMIEYTRNEDKPNYALCRIIVVNKKNATSQQQENKEIDHTDSNNGDKHKTSLSPESMQEDNKNNVHDRPLSSSQQPEGNEIVHGSNGHKGGTYQNTTADYNQQNLETKLRELTKHHSVADIRKGLDQVESEILSAASPKEDSTEAPVSNTTHGRCTYTNTMEASTSTKWQEQAKVEMFESNTYQEKPTNLRCDTNRNCLEKNDEQGRSYWEQQLLSSCNTDDCFKWDDIHLDKNCIQLDSELAELTADVQEPHQVSHNFNTNSTVAMDCQNRIESYPSTSNFANTEGRLDHQMVEPNAHFQEPKLYDNIIGNSTEPVLNNNHLLSCNQNISAPGPSTSNYATFVGRSDQQIVHPNAYVQQHNIFHHNYNGNPTAPMLNNNHLLSSYWNISAEGLSTSNYTTSVSGLDQQEQSELYHNFNGNPTAPMLNSNHLPSFYQNISAPGLSTSNYANSVDGSDQQMVEPNAHFQEPKLYDNIIGNSTETVLNNNHLLSCNQNISAPGPSTSNYSAFMDGSDEQEFEQNVQDPYNVNVNLTETTENGCYLPFYYAPTVPPITDQGTCNAIEEHQFALCNTQHGQMFEPDAYVLEPNNSSYNFKTISTEPTEMGNHLPIYNKNTIAPGLDTNNNATTEPEDMEWRSYLN